MFNSYNQSYLKPCESLVVSNKNNWLAQTTTPTPYVETANWYATGNYATQAQLQAAIYLTPNTVYIDASSTAFQQYTSGVFTNSTACGTAVDHGVLAVGYSTSTSGNNYWIVQNSWGSSWGEGGYVNIGMASGPGICGINSQIYYPLVQKPV